MGPVTNHGERLSSCLRWCVFHVSQQTPVLRIMPAPCEEASCLVTDSPQPLMDRSCLDTHPLPLRTEPYTGTYSTGTPEHLRDHTTRLNYKSALDQMSTLPLYLCLIPYARLWNRGKNLNFDGCYVETPNWRTRFAFRNRLKTMILSHVGSSSWPDLKTSCQLIM